MFFRSISIFGKDKFKFIFIKGYKINPPMFSHFIKSVDHYAIRWGTSQKVIIKPITSNNGHQTMPLKDTNNKIKGYIAEYGIVLFMKKMKIL